MIKYAHEQFFLSANELVNSLQSKNSKSYWTFVKRMMKGTGHIVSEVAFSIWWLMPSSPQALPI
jgi:hypothetical protein